MLEKLKARVCEANLELLRQGLVVQTFGNVSGIAEDREHVVIKPSGVDYDSMLPDDMVVVSTAKGEVVEGRLSPSSDTRTHLKLYHRFPGVGGIAHTHSLCATAWAQAQEEIPCLGTTHADYFHGPIPCTRMPGEEEIAGDYEVKVGGVIAELFTGMNPMHFPGVLVAAHGPFAWGKTPEDAVKAAFIIEYLAGLASETLRIDPNAKAIPDVLLDKHFFRKHGPAAYYGQEGEGT